MIGALEQQNVSQFTLKLEHEGGEANSSGAKGPVRSLPQVKDKILKYDAFLLKNK